MTRSLIAFVLATLACEAPTNALDDRDPKASALTIALTGDWKGSLEYRDYSNDKLVTLPTTLEARAAEDGRSVTLSFRYDEGRNRFVESKNRFRIDSKAQGLAWESESGKQSDYQLQGLDTFAEKSQGDLVLIGSGSENDVKVDVRQTITLKGDDLTILKETRKPGAEFAFRNAYRFRKATAK